MNILIDIGHPAHVHYFRNFISEMQKKGHSFLITARDKEVTHDLLNKFKLPFVNRGKGGNGLVAKLLYMPRAVNLLLSISRKFKPDLFLSFASPYAAQAAYLLGKHHITITDTEHARIERLFYIPFSKVLITPSSFMGSLGTKQVRVPAFVEFLYLHRKRFIPNSEIRKDLGLNLEDKFLLLRFISWSASHDIGQKGIPDAEKIKLVSKFQQLGYAVKISAEGQLSEELQPFQLKTESNRIHDVVAEADLFIGESGTMATEACLLGTPAFLVNSLDAGVFREEVQRGLLWHFKSGEDISDKILSIISEPTFKAKHQVAVEKLHAEKIDFTEFLVRFFEHYPESFSEIKKNPYSLNKG